MPQEETVIDMKPHLKRTFKAVSKSSRHRWIATFPENFESHE